MPPTAKRPRSVTLADVARYAGVSSAVVSYVVNNGPRPVAADTAERVREAIAVLGYRPNTHARALSTGSTRMLGVVHPGTANPFFGEYNDVIFDTANKAGLALLTASSAGSADTEKQLTQELAGRNVDGIIVMTSMTKDDVPGLRDAGVPVLFVNCPFPVPGYRTIGPDSFNGAKRLVDHLIGEHRHRNVALIAGGGGSDPEDRERGWRHSHELNGCAPGPVARTDYSVDGGYDAACRLLADRDRPTAIFVSSDLEALGVLHAIHDHGLRIPHDVAVVSFDGIAESAHAWPPLTVARQPVHAMAQIAVDDLIGAAPPAHTLIETDLVLRRSCGCTSDRIVLAGS